MSSRAYGAKLVQTEAHLLSSVRYIVQNPVRARMVEHPGEWPWSSDNATAGLAPPPRFLTIGLVLGHFAADRASAQRGFTAFIEETLEPPLEALGDLYLGDTQFARSHAPNRPIEEIPPPQPPRRPPLADLLADPGGAGISAAYRHGYTLAQIARHLGVHYSTISRQLRAHEATTLQRKT